MKFDASPNDQVLLNAIARRWLSIAREYFKRTRGRDLSQGDIDVLQLTVDLYNVHCNGRPLRLFDMLHGDATQLQEDFAAIHQHVDRVNGGIPLQVPLHFATNGTIPSPIIRIH